MTPREIIAEAWAITIREKALRRWGFTAALFETLRNIELLLYQGYYLYMFSQGVSVGWLSVEKAFFDNLPFWAFVTVTVMLIVLLILQLFLPTLCTGAIIGLAAKARRKEEMNGGLVLGLYNFFPILEVHGLFVLSSMGILVTIISMIYRYGGAAGESAKYAAIGMVLMLWVVASVFRFFASFSEEGIVLRKSGVFGAIGRSFKIIVSHLSHIMFLIVLLLVIGVRIAINAVMLLLLPALAIGLGLLLTLFLNPTLSTIIAVIFGILLVIPLSYFFAYLQVFKQTVWTLTYLELSEKKDLDVIL